jgi:hypothetical protein
MRGVTQRLMPQPVSLEPATFDDLIDSWFPPTYVFKGGVTNQKSESTPT